MSDRITIRLDEVMRRIIEGMALAERKSASQIVRDALNEYLKAIEAKG
jgi:predicted transcriptional regulator